MSKEQADFEAPWKWPFHPVAGCAGARGHCTKDQKIVMFMHLQADICPLLNHKSHYMFLLISPNYKAYYDFTSVFTEELEILNSSKFVRTSSWSSQRDKADTGWENISQNKYKLAKSEDFYCWILWEQAKIAPQSPAIIFKSFWKSEKLTKTTKCQQRAWNLRKKFSN